MADDTHELAAPPEVNPPPPEAAVAAFVARETVAILFVAFWMLLFAGELVTGAYTLPLWYHCVAVGVLAYALGLNVATLTAARAPQPGKRAARAAVRELRD